MIPFGAGTKPDRIGGQKRIYRQGASHVHISLVPNSKILNRISHASCDPRFTQGIGVGVCAFDNTPRATKRVISTQCASGHIYNFPFCIGGTKEIGGACAIFVGGGVGMLGLYNIIFPGTGDRGGGPLVGPPTVSWWGPAFPLGLGGRYTLRFIPLLVIF
eukprot:GHVO01069650.1.p1 GENE.GHVO01069650.1~~GHVO01069650.1.p1  ORF type:complete len:160 (-),score=21.10 GHVO01069650.1:144-623(-)